MTTAEAKALIRPMLSDKRYHHSLCVAKEAVRLAMRFGADAEKASSPGFCMTSRKRFPRRNNCN